MSDPDSLEIPAPPPLVPLKTPQELKDRTMRDYMRNAGLPGMPSDPLAIERLVLSDLQLAENYEREEGPSLLPPKARQETPEEVADREMEEERRLNAVLPPSTQIIRQEIHRQVTSFLDLPPEIEHSPKWRHALGRMTRIMAGATAAPRTADGRLDFRAMCATCEDPKGAYEWLSDMASFEYRYYWVTRKHNPFYGMSKRDASLAFVRRTMDICDRSTRTSMGGWWVK